MRNYPYGLNDKLGCYLLEVNNSAGEETVVS